MMYKSFAVLVTLVLLAGCGHAPKETVSDSATSYQAVGVATPGVTGARCFVQSGVSSYTLASTPGKVMVRRAPDPLDVTCFKGAHMVGNTTVRPTVAPREAKAAYGHVCESCLYPENVSVVMALRSSSVEKNNVRMWTE